MNRVKKIFLRWRCLFAFLLFGLNGLGFLIYKNGGALAFYIPEYNINKYNLSDYPYIYSFILGFLLLFIFVSICAVSYKNPNINLPKIRIDLIPPDDRQWIKEIKERKTKGEKIIAYSTDGKEAAKRKARRLGIEDCFYGYKSEKEIIALREEEK